MFRRNKSSDNSSDGLGLETLWPSHGASDQDAILDIVFVHGLGGSRFSTWKKGSVVWPRDLLPQDFPGARIMTWGYDANVMQFFGPVGQGNIQDHAKALNWDLSQERVEDYQKARPIIFIAHSLGGLIVKDALFLSYLEGVKEAPAAGDKTIAAIKWSTMGVLFAGTPHRGADKAMWATTATNLAWFIQKDHSTQLLDTLKRGSEVLERLQYHFKDILQSFAIYTLLEEIGYPKIGKVVEKDSAVIGWHEKEILMHANHSDMIKFSSQAENEYRKVRNIIREIIRTSERGRSQGNEISPPPGQSSSAVQPSSSSLPGSSQNSSIGRQGLLTYQQHGSEATTTLDEPLERLNIQGSRSSRRCEDLAGAQMSPARDFSLSLDQGNYFLKRRQKKTLAQDLVTARRYFVQARKELLESSSLENAAAFVRVYYGLMNVEMDMSYNRELSLEERGSHLQKAEDFGSEALAFARKSPNAGDVAQVKLEQAVVKGRRAEFEVKRGVSSQEIRRMKNDALRDISGALRELQESNRSNFNENLIWAEQWRDRLTSS